jgi:predicted nuclease of predicted toxin-antitoxin system
VKLLVDENLSHHLVAALWDLYPESVHARDIGLKASPDSDLWSYAECNGLVIVSKDADFYQRSLVHGPPPKIVWIRRGNCSTKDIEGILRTRYEDIRRFVEELDSSCLILY